MTKLQMLQQLDFAALPPWAQLVLIILVVFLIALGVAQLFTDEPPAAVQPGAEFQDRMEDL